MKLYELFRLDESETGGQLAVLVAQDQKERNEYQQFVQTKAGGDWDKGAKLYASLKNRKPDDIFGEKERLIRFTKMNFDFNTFSDDDWGNYWLLSQHCDFDISYQQQALKNIEKYRGQESNQYKYLYDRISCSLSGTQKFGTQNICAKH